MRTDSTSDDPTAQAQAIMERVLRLVTDCRMVLRALERPSDGESSSGRGRADSLLHPDEYDRRRTRQDDGRRPQRPTSREPAARANGCRVAREAGGEDQAGKRMMLPWFDVHCPSLIPRRMVRHTEDAAMKNLAHLVLTVAGLFFLLTTAPSWGGQTPGCEPPGCNSISSDLSFNTGGGSNAVFGVTTGRLNTGFGENALADTPTGSSNTTTRTSALGHNISGSNNTASGDTALF